MDLLTISFGTFLRSLSLCVPICVSLAWDGDAAQMVERALSLHADDPGSVSGRGVNVL